MLEYWNIGLRPACLASLASGQGNENNLEMIFFGLLSPTFHYSTIPTLHIDGTENCHKKIYNFNVLQKFRYVLMCPPVNQGFVSESPHPF